MARSMDKGLNVPLEILLVEDNTDDVLLIENELTDSEVQIGITVASQLHEAMGFLDQHAFDVILLDLSLPDASGFETAKQVLAKTSRVPIIVFSALDDQDLALQVVEAGAQDYLVKGQETGASILRSIRYAIERKRSERALQESERRFRQLAEHINAVFWIRNGTGEQLLYVSPAYERIWGRTCESLQEHPMDWSTSIHVEDRERVNEAFCQNLTQGSYAEEYRVEHLDGSIRWIQDRGFPIQEEGGKVSRVVGIAADITEQKKAEELLLQQEMQLRQSQKMEALGTLVGGIAHDFNNILMAMLGYTELCFQTLVGGSQGYRYLQQVLKAGLRGKSLVNKILAFSRPTDREPKPIRLHQIVEEVIALLRSTLPASLDIQVQVNTKADMVLADATELHQVVMNLCTNAEHAMREVGGKLTIRLEAVEVLREGLPVLPKLKPGPYVLLSCQDTGHGMKKETRERIFEPFFTTKEIGEGTGMGLALVHRIITNSGGDIIVQSSPGQGATFSIYLPSIDIPLQNNEGSWAGSSRLGKGRVLLVDDEEALVQLEKEFLEQLGYEPVACHSGFEVLERFRAAPDGYDVVITDQAMPKMSGDELARHLLTIRPELPIVLCTGFSQSMTSENAKAVGIRAFLTKPIMKEDLAETLSQLLERSAI